MTPQLLRFVSSCQPAEDDDQKTRTISCHLCFFSIHIFLKNCAASNLPFYSCSTGLDTELYLKNATKILHFCFIRWDTIFTSTPIYIPEEGGQILCFGRSLEVYTDGAYLLFALCLLNLSMYLHPDALKKVVV